jgi:hypothetical protein
VLKKIWNLSLRMLPGFHPQQLFYLDLGFDFQIPDIQVSTIHNKVRGLWHWGTARKDNRLLWLMLGWGTKGHS